MELAGHCGVFGRVRAVRRRQIGAGLGNGAGEAALVVAFAADLAQQWLSLR